MQLLTQALPSGKRYPFDSIRIMPMNFAQILEYEENAPDPNKNPIENYYFNYCIVKEDDPNVDNLLLIDYEYVLYMKKGLTISENLTFESTVKCPRCGTVIPYRVSLAEVEWNKLDPEVLEGLEIDFSNQKYKIRVPTVTEFLNIFKKYRLYKKLTDMRIIKLIALFEDAQSYTQKIEQLVVNSTYKDVATLFMIDRVFYSFIKPKIVKCPTCINAYIPEESEIIQAKEKYNIEPDKELPEVYVQEIKNSKGGVEISLEAMVSNFFRDVVINNRFTTQETAS